MAYTPVQVLRAMLAMLPERVIEPHTHYTLQHTLVYCAYGWTGAVRQEILIDECPIADYTGPVFPSLAAHLAERGSVLHTPLIALPLGIFEVLELVARKYGHWSNHRCITMHHAFGSAWEATFFQKGTRAPISYWETLMYFSKLARAPRLPS